jgi:hypothetical protein
MHIDYMLSQLTLASVNDDSSTKTEPSPTSRLQEYLTERQKYHFAGSLLSFFSLRRRDELCPLWKMVKSAIVGLSQPLADAERIAATTAGSTGGASSNAFLARKDKPAVTAHFPASWSNFHLCVAARNPAWMSFLVTAIAHTKGSQESLISPQTPRGNNAPNAKTESVEDDRANLEKFRENISSMLLCCCYYNDKLSIVNLIEFVAQEIKEKQLESGTYTSDFESSGRLLAAIASATNVLDTLFPGQFGENTNNQLLSSVQALTPRKPKGGSVFQFEDAVTADPSLSVQLPSEVKSLLMESDKYEPLGKLFTPLDLCLHHRSDEALLLLLRLGIPISFDAAMNAVCSGKFAVSTLVAVLEAVHAIDKDEFLTNINKKTISGAAGKGGSKETKSSSSSVPEFVSKSKAMSQPTEKLASTSTGELLLHYCARRGYAVLAKRLLELGADPCALDKNSLTALHYSIYSGHKSITRAIVIHSRTEEFLASAPDKNPITAMTEAVKTIEFHVRRFLLCRYRRRDKIASFKRALRKKRSETNVILTTTDDNANNGSGEINNSARSDDFTDSVRREDDVDENVDEEY